MLERLKKKISEAPDYVNQFSKPDTFSTNEDGNPLEPTTTGLSPYISTGCLSARHVWSEVEIANLNSEHTEPPRSLIGQLMFREMFYLLRDQWKIGMTIMTTRIVNELTGGVMMRILCLRGSLE